MPIFKKNKILSTSEAVAESLRLARQEKGVGLGEVSRELNINRRYLRAMEAGEFDKLPPGIYRKNFLKEYAFYLGLDYQGLARAIEDDLAVNPSARADKKIFSNQIVKSSNLLVVPKIIRSIVVILVALALFIYLGLYLKEMVVPPEVDIIEPADKAVINVNSVVVYGTTEPEAQIEINGQAVSIRADGVFSQEIDLKDGINTIIIKVKKKYGREKIIQRQVLVK